MGDHSIEAMIELQRVIGDVAGDAAAILGAGDSALISVQKYTKKAAEKLRTNAMNKLSFHMYDRIGKTLMGGNELHARRECKLTIGCRILRRDSDEFSATYDLIIRPLGYEQKLRSMDLISVSSIMTVKQFSEYIKRVIEKYSENGVYFLDLEGASDYVNYPEASK
jgi:hypothetical protein